jgi:SAM-dependent methyltransferase
MDRYDARSYGEAYADVYDDWYGDLAGTAEAVAMLAHLAGGGPVLELAAGTGRLALPLVVHGVTVVGLDASTPMLDQLRAKDTAGAVAAVQADMAALPFRSAAFALAFVAANSLFNLFTEEDQRRCLADTAAALLPGGALVVEAFVPDDRHRGGAVVEARTVERDRVTLFVSKEDAEAQTVAAQIIELTEAGGVGLRPVFLRYLRPAQLDDLAVAVGLRLEERWAAWDRSAFTEDSPGHVSVYRKGEP